MDPIPSAGPTPPRRGWRRLVPGTLFGQVLAALLAGIVAAQVTGAWIVLDDRAHFAARIAGGHAAQRIAGILTALEHTGGDERHHVARALGVPPTRVSLGDAWQAEPSADPEARAFADEVAASLDRPLVLQVLSIRRDPGPGGRREPGGGPGGFRAPPDEAPPGLRPPADERPMPRADGERRFRRPVMRVVLQARLGDGTVATVRQVLPTPPGDEPLRLLGWLAAVMAITALLAGWIVRRLTRPLAGFAAAATGLARDLDQPPLPEHGPREIASAARAFNQMQRDLRRMVETRAQALAAVSHDLRLPLTRVRLRLEALPDDQSRAAIEGDLAEMDRMIGNTLEFLRGGASREPAAPVDVTALLESIADDMETLGAQVQVSGHAGPPLTVRPLALTRCLSNLVDNARRYGGDAPVDVSVHDRGASVEILIEDRGPGIPEADRERVFEPYVRLDTSRAAHTGGTGLGLAIARAIARAHGGDVGLADRPGGGLRAWVRLPRSAPQASPATPG